MTRLAVGNSLSPERLARIFHQNGEMMTGDYLSKHLSAFFEPVIFNH